MATLTTEQRVFLKSQKIPFSELFDASGMRKADYQAAMDEEGKHFAYGVTPCNAAGHTLRTKAGHCIQCDTAKVAFALRSSKRATVYIAGSISQKLIKVGSTVDHSIRVRTLNDNRYGDAIDWEMLVVCTVPSAGKIEFLMHEKLEPHNVGGYYVKSGRRQACYELFNCGYGAAIKALKEVLPADSRLTYAGNEERFLSVY